jgi:predicted molibdopterin-dependent oxidoreductase YjgC
VPAAADPRDRPHLRPAPTAQICWTLGITEHHNAVDNVLALINLALLTGHVGRYGSGLVPLRGQNNVQGGGDMGALPDRLTGFQHVENAPLREKFERVWGAPIPPKKGWHLSHMFDAMERGELRALYVVGENPMRSEADQHRTRRLLEGLDFLVVQDVMPTATAEAADVVLPAAAGWCESEGTVTSSERRVQRVRRAVPPPAGVRDDLEIFYELAKRLGRDWGAPDPEAIWNEVRQVSPVHAGMSYARLEAEGGLQWPCYDESIRASCSCTAGSGSARSAARGRRSRWSSTIRRSTGSTTTSRCASPPAAGSRSTTPACRPGRYAYPRRRGETLDVSPEDAARYGVAEGDRVRVVSRRGEVVAPVHIDPALRPGLTFMTMHFPEEVATNLLTIDATDPVSGTAEFKATAIRIERLEA